MVARAVQELPEGDDWVYEVKLDGYRALILKSHDRIQVRSRNDKDLTAAYPGVATAAAGLHADSVAIDGEIVAVDEKGRPSFQALQHRGAHPGHKVVFYAFDLLHLDGKDLRRLPLEERKRRLADVVRDSRVPLSSFLPGSAADVIAAVRGLGLEGVIAKRKASLYSAEHRGHAWVKLKLDRQQEFVVGGYRPGSNGLDALIVGYYEGRTLKFAAKVRAGFTPHLRREVVARLKPLHSGRCPFADLPTGRETHWGGGVTPEQMLEMQWIAPRLVAQVRFVEWTADGHLRHSSFLGLRDDKSPADVQREP